MDYEPLQLVQIYFDTATFDEISRNAYTFLDKIYWCQKKYILVSRWIGVIFRDVKNTVETQISVIGGTMGLFSGIITFLSISFTFLCFPESSFHL